MGTTYAKLDSYTVGAATSASITFNNINQSYTDLVIKVSSRSTAADNWMTIAYNGLTTPITSFTLSGDGASVTANRRTDNFVLPNGNSSYTANAFANGEIYMPSYANPNNQKFIIADGVNENNATTALSNESGMFLNNQNPITSVTLTPNSGSFAQYSTFTLYGVFKYDVTAVPTAPTIGTAIAGAGIASVSFTGTTDAGSYTVTSNPSGISSIGYASPVTINGLANGTAYTFTVKGNNGYGAGASSAASGSVTPQNYAGYWAGGDPSTFDHGGISYIWQLAYNNEVVTTLNQYLSASCVYVAAFANSNVAGYFTGGQVRNYGATSLILSNNDKLTFATTTKSVSTAMPASRSAALANANSGTAGYAVNGGDSLGNLNTTVKFAFSPETWTTIAATTAYAASRGASCANSGTAGYMFGGSGATYNTIQKLLYSNDTISTIAGTLTYASYTATAVSNNGTAGYYLGGYNGNMITQIDKVAFSSDTKSGLSARLASSFVSADAGAHSYSGVAGYVGAGYDSTGFTVIPSGSATGSKAQINKLTYSTEVVSVLTAVMIQDNILDMYGCANSGTL